eukprot:1178945-Prorocentrum_minimum.AAC.4
MIAACASPRAEPREPEAVGRERHAVHFPLHGAQVGVVGEGCAQLGVHHLALRAGYLLVEHLQQPLCQLRLQRLHQRGHKGGHEGGHEISHEGGHEVSHEGGHE